MPPYSPLALANTFIRLSEGSGVEHMKLQKLAYFAYGWWLAYHDAPLLNDGPELWKFGPVFGNLYRVLAPFGSSPIAAPQRAIPMGTAPAINDDETDDLARWVWERYGGYSSFTLSDLTHQTGTPWQTEAARHGYRVPPHHRIPDGVIRDYFRQEAERLQPA